MSTRRGESSLADQRSTVGQCVGVSPDFIAFPRQVHSNIVHYVSSGGPAGRGDGLITNCSRTALSIQVADCVPIFVHDPQSNAVGLVHAGWRGTALGIARKAVEEMARYCGIKAENLEIFLGPSIRSCCYVVGTDVVKQFDRKYVNDSADGACHLDLQQANRQQLQSAGVMANNIREDGRCTFCDAAGFQSYRRDGADAGRMVCLIMFA